ncbi:MAG: ribonuclease M5 [Bacillota bacterium]
MNNQIIVVEGIHDQAKIKQIYPNIACIVTNGSEVSDEKINLIYELSKENEVILFLDPDTPGKKIMQKILATNGDFSIAYINKEKAISKNKKKVGIEHASTKDIKDALKEKVDINKTNNYINISDLYKRGLINQKDAFKKRIDICKRLNIPVANGKTFLNFLNMLGIGLERIDQIINEKS